MSLGVRAQGLGPRGGGTALAITICSVLPSVPVWSKYSNAHHHERNHQGKENLLLFPASDQLPQSERKVRSRERLRGLLRFYHREAA